MSAKPQFQPIKKILIANRGEIACRIIRTCRRLGIKSVAVYSEADISAQHTLQADERFLLGSSESAQSYLNFEKIIAIAKQTQVDAIHPGYGFLSENADFAQAVRKAKIEFIGPSAASIQLLGNKVSAKALAEKVKVPLVPGISWPASTKVSEQVKLVKDFVRTHDYPFVIKAAAGGGGRGMRVIREQSQITTGLESASREAQAFFSDRHIFVEKLIGTNLCPARHIEVQIFGDKYGDVIHLYDRDCSLQRNHQKVIEEAPAPNLAPEVRNNILAAALKIAKAAKYFGAGTVEFLVDSPGNFYFLEVNTRLQVEHPVTEAITGLDLVELQIKIAQGFSLTKMSPLPTLEKCGTAIEARICAEDSERDFLPATGEITRFDIATPLCTSESSCRVDTGFVAGDRVSHYYDSLLAKLIVHAPTRELACQEITRSLQSSIILGLTTNVGFLIQLLQTKQFLAANQNISSVHEFLSLKFKIEPVLAACAKIQSVYSPRANDNSAWSKLDGFRLSGNHRARTRYKIGNPCSASETEIQLKMHELNHFEFLDNKQTDNYLKTLNIIGWSDSGFDFQFESKRYFFKRLEDSENNLFQTSWGVFQITEVTETIGTKRSGEITTNSLAQLVAPLPGKIVLLSAEVGDQVQVGKKLVVIESMKMEHPLFSPCTGKVTAIKTAVGQVISAGAILVEFE